MLICSAALSYYRVIARRVAHSQTNLIVAGMHVFNNNLESSPTHTGPAGHIFCISRMHQLNPVGKYSTSLCTSGIKEQMALVWTWAERGLIELYFKSKLWMEIRSSKK